MSINSLSVQNEYSLIWLLLLKNYFTELIFLSKKIINTEKLSIVLTGS